MTWAVISQVRREWPAKVYSFADEAQARMFHNMCERDGDFACAIQGVPPVAKEVEQ